MLKLKLKHQPIHFFSLPPPSGESMTLAPYRRDVHMARIIPVASHPKLSIQRLPLTILDEIVKLAIESSQPEWGGFFLEQTYTQFPWRRLLNLFWQKVGGPQRVRIVHPVQVAQNIIREPELARYIKHFKLDDLLPTGALDHPAISMSQIDDGTVLFLQQVVDYLRMCHLDARVFNKSLPRTRYLIERLTKVERLSMDLAGGKCGLTLAGEVQDVQKLIRGWRRLKYLSFMGAGHDWGRNEKTRFDISSLSMSS